MVVKTAGETAQAKKPPPPFYGKEDRRALRAMYPSDDDNPLPDAFFQLPHFSYVKDAITAWFDGRDDVVVGGDNFVYYMDGDNRANLAPDCFVAIGVNKAEVLEDWSYFVWRAGKMLDFVMEIASRSTAKNDLGDKYRKYESLGVGEYWMMDPSGGEFYGKPLMGFVNVDGAFVPIPMDESANGDVAGYCEILDLTFRWIAERNEFRIVDPHTGKDFATYAEYLDRAERSAAALAHTKDALAASETARAESERARARTEDALTASEASRIESELELAQSEAIRQRAQERAVAEAERARQAVERARAESERLRSERIAREQAEEQTRMATERARAKAELMRSEIAARRQIEARARDAESARQDAEERARAEESARAEAEAEVERLRAALRDIQAN